MVRKYHLKLMFFGFFMFFILSCVLYTYSNSNNRDIAANKFVKCDINSQTSKCLISEKNVYLPASMISLLYDTHGYLDKKANVYYLNQNDIKYNKSNNYFYNCLGKYLFFNKYNVEFRSKVKNISIDEGVPISIQWDKRGYKYPIQIAQFGLSHYSKWIELKENQQIVDAFNLVDYKILPFIWVSPLSSNKIVKFNSDGIHFFSTKTVSEDDLRFVFSIVDQGNRATLNKIVEGILKMPTIDDITLPEIHLVGHDWEKGSAIHFKMKNKLIGSLHLLYVCGSFEDTQAATNVFVYTIKDCSQFNIVRNLYYDIIKLLPPNVVEQNLTLITALKSSLIEDIILYGEGSITTFQMCNQFSYEKFLIAADWFVNNQDRNGGWPTNVVRRIYANVKLAPGWYSAMAQGHAISLLIRAHHTTSDRKYLDAASKALALFEVDTHNHGIRTHFLGKPDLVWYEEYPTNPSLFVLNGFIYSLFGLLDYTQYNGNLTVLATRLLNSGLTTLQTLLPLFDSGSGSFYDLRHITFPLGNVTVNKKQVRPFEVHDGPNRARWEYHVVHIEQLLYLANSLRHGNTHFVSTANRFIAYLNGYRSSHN